MTTREQWLALAERCEKAAGPDLEIDEAISRAVTPAMLRGWALKPYTASLDAITALIERELPEGSWFADINPIYAYEPPSGATVYYDKVSAAKRVGAATPALALCAAFCRAMAEKA